jgi:hypothetical protein
MKRTLESRAFISATRGDEPEVVIQRIADYRADDKSDPNYYARHTVTKARIALDATATKTPNDGESKGEEMGVVPEH